MRWLKVKQTLCSGYSFTAKNWERARLTPINQKEYRVQTQTESKPKKKSRKTPAKAKKTKAKPKTNGKKVILRRAAPKVETPVEVKSPGLQLNLPVEEYRALPIPGVGEAKLGVCYVRAVDLPPALDSFMSINPRVPSRTARGILTGPVAHGILETLRNNPDQMAVKNQGIYLMVDHVDFAREKGGKGVLHLRFTDPGKHGIINGGHTYAAVREAVESAEGEELEALKNAYVRLHIYENIEEDFVPEIAEGLNRSKQVDNPSLVNLQGEFDIIRKVMRGTAGEKAIAYHQGDSGDIYISELLVGLELFNKQRFSDKKHPNSLYNRQSLGLKYFSEDMELSKGNLDALIKKLPDFLWLSDSIRKLTPEAAKRNNFKFGQMKAEAKVRAGGPKQRGIALPFLGETVNYRVPNGWVYPMLAAFRANLRQKNGKSYEWIVPLAEILPEVIDELVGVCVVEHRDNNTRPELIGKRESSYSQCYTKIQLYLAKRGQLE